MQPSHTETKQIEVFNVLLMHTHRHPYYTLAHTHHPKTHLNVQHPHPPPTLSSRDTTAIHRHMSSQPDTSSPPHTPRMRGSNTGRTRLSWEKPSVQPLLSAPKHHSQLSVPEHTHTDIHTHHSCTHTSSTHLKQRQKTLASRDWYKHYRERERSHMTHMSHGSQ